jgi:hypothetical protein
MLRRKRRPRNQTITSGRLRQLICGQGFFPGDRFESVEEMREAWNDPRWRDAVREHLLERQQRGDERAISWAEEHFGPID